MKKIMPEKRILIVEDETIVANDISTTLKSLGYSVAGFSKTGEGAIEKSGIIQPDLILMDIHLAGRMDGVEAAGKILELYNIPVIYLTAYADKTLIERAKITKPYGYIIKPYDDRELDCTIQMAIYKHAFEIAKLNKQPELEFILSKSLIDNLDYLDQISYNNDIKKFKLHYNECSTIVDLYSLVMKTLEQLWVAKYDKDEAYEKFEIYKNYENLLFKDSHYREHFIHQFQVFLCGLPILSVNHKEITKRYTNFFGGSPANVQIDFSWMLAATYHDIGYLVQKYETWLTFFFKDFLNVNKMSVSCDLGELLVEKNFQDYLDKLTSLHTELTGKCENNWIYNGRHKINHTLRRTLTSELISHGNHGLFSALILLDQIENSRIYKDKPELFDSTFSSAIMPACLAIALHDKDIFTNDQIRIDFTRDPLSTILIYCDTIQEWGRPFNSISDHSINTMPFLTNYVVDNKKACATLTYRKIIEIPKKGNLTNFELKRQEIEKVLEKIHSDKYKFKIRLESQDKDHPHSSRIYESS